MCRCGCIDVCSSACLCVSVCLCTIVVGVFICMDISNLVTSVLSFSLNATLFCVSLSFLLYCVSDYIT